MAKQDFVAKLQIQNEESKKKIKELKDEISALKTQNQLLGQTARKAANEASGAWKMWGDSLKGSETFVGKLQRSISGLSSSGFGGLSSAVGMNIGSLAKFGTIVGGATVAIGAFKDFAEQAVVSSANFGKSISELSAITGVSGKGLDELRDKVEKLAKDTNSRGTDVSKNFAQIGSALPTLLKDTEGMSKVSNSAITLQKAGLMTLQDATDSLTTAMAQFSLGADKSEKVIDVLANSAQLGSAGISEIASALKVCGTQADSAGVNISQTSALLEVLASKSVKGSEAGTALRNIFSKMQTKGVDEMNPKIVGLSSALEYLATKADDAVFMAKTFGAENASAAMIIGKNIEVYNQLVEGIDRVGTAQEMATKNTDNLASDFEAMQVQWENLLSSFSVDGENNPIRTIVQEITNIITALNEMFASVESGTSALGEAMSDVFGDTNFEPLTQLLGIFTDLIKFITGLNSQFNILGRVVDNVSEGWGSLGVAVKIVREILFWIESAILALIKDFKKFFGMFSNLSFDFPLLNKLKGYLKNIIDGLKDVINWYKRMKAAVKGELYTEPTSKSETSTSSSTSSTASTNPETTPEVENAKQTLKKQETALQKYNRELAIATYKYVNGLSKQTDFYHDQAKAIESYINELSSTTKSLKQNKTLIQELNKKVKQLKESATILTAINNTQRDLATNNKKFSDGLMTLNEFSTGYTNSLKKLIDAFYQLDNVSTAQRDAQKQYIEKLKLFEYQLGKIESEYKKKLDKVELDKSVTVENGNIKDIMNDIVPSDYYKTLREAFAEFKSIPKLYENEKSRAMETATTMGVEFNLEDFNQSFEKQFQKLFDKYGLKIGSDGVITGYFYLTNKGFKNEGVAGPIDQMNFDFDDIYKYIKKTEPNFKGDKSNFSLNATSNSKLVKETDFKQKTTGIDKYQSELNKLLDLHKKIEDSYTSMLEKGYNSGDIEVKVDTTILDDLESKIQSTGKKLQDALNLKMTVEGVGELMNGISTIGHTVQSFTELSDRLSNAKDGLDQFLIVFDTLISTFETVNGLIQTYNTIQTLFAGVSAASAVATESQVVAQGEKSVSDATVATTSAAATVAMKAEEAAALELASALIFASHAELPFGIGIGMASAQISAMLGAMAGFKASIMGTLALAQGGIIPGSHLSGDMQTVRVNAGEMVLNTRQQKNLFNLLDGNNTLGNAQPFGEVKFRIEGKQLVGVLNNFNTSKSKLR